MEVGLGPGRFCVSWGPRLPLPKKGAEPPTKLSAHVYCHQTAGCIKMPLGMEVGLSPGDLVMGTQPPPKKGAEPPPQILAHFYCAKTAGCHLYGASPQARGLCVRLGTQPPPKKGAEPPQNFFGPSLLWPNGLMDPDGTWQRGRPQPRRLCVRWGPSLLPKKGSEPPPQFSAKCLLCPNGWMYDDAIWYGGRPKPRGLCVRWGPSLPSPKRGRTSLPNFRPMSIVAKRLGGSRWHLVWRWVLVQATLC